MLKLVLAGLILSSLQLHARSSEPMEEIKGTAECRCKKQKRSDARRYNQEFLEKHLTRLQNDIQEIEKEKKARGKGESREWQNKCDDLILDDKRQALKRIEGYANDISRFNNTHVILRDLYVDHDPNTCKPDCDERKKKLKFKMENSKLPLSKEDFAEMVDCHIGKKFMFKEFAPISDDNKEMKERCPDDQPKPKSKGSDKSEADCDCIVNEPKIPEALAERHRTMIQKLIDAISCNGPLTCVSSAQDFYKELGIEDDGSKLPEKIDLSKFFSKMQRQEKTFTCLGFAVSADIEAELYKQSLGNNEIPPPDPWTVFSVMAGNPNGKSCKGYEKGVDYYGKSGMGLTLPDSMYQMAHKPICLPGTDTKFTVDGAVVLKDADAVDLDLVKRVLAHDKTLTATISTEITNKYENWVRPVDGGGGHAVEIVGVGRGIDPVSLQSEPYVLLRDSFHDENCHTRMTFKDLKRVLVTVSKIKKVNLITSP